mgnify:FL=1
MHIIAGAQFGELCHLQIMNNQETAASTFM